MKRLLSVLLALVMVLSLAGCGGKDSGSPGTSSGTSSGGSGDNGGSGDGDVYAEDGWAEGRMGATMHAYGFNYIVNSA